MPSSWIRIGFDRIADHPAAEKQTSTLQELPKAAMAVCQK